MDVNIGSKKDACQSVDESMKCASNFNPNLYVKSEKIALLNKYSELRFKNPKMKDCTIAKELGVTVQYLNKRLREIGVIQERKRYTKLKYLYDSDIQQFTESQYGNFRFDVKTNNFVQIPETKKKITLTEKRNILAAKNQSVKSKSKNNISAAGVNVDENILDECLNDDEIENICGVGEFNAKDEMAKRLNPNAILPVRNNK